MLIAVSLEGVKTMTKSLLEFHASEMLVMARGAVPVYVGGGFCVTDGFFWLALNLMVEFVTRPIYTRAIAIKTTVFHAGQGTTGTSWPSGGLGFALISPVSGAFLSLIVILLPSRFTMFQT